MKEKFKHYPNCKSRKLVWYFNFKFPFFHIHRSRSTCICEINRILDRTRDK